MTIKGLELVTFHGQPGDDFMGQEILADDDPRAAIMELQPWVVIEFHQHPLTGQIGVVVAGPFDTKKDADDYGRWLVTDSPPKLQPADVTILQMVVDPRRLEALELELQTRDEIEHGSWCVQSGHGDSAEPFVHGPLCQRDVSPSDELELRSRTDNDPTENGESA